MPLYNFRNKETGEVVELSMRISELDQYKASHPEMEIVHLSAATVVRDVGLKPSDGFRDVLKSIKKANIGSNIETF